MDTKGKQSKRILDILALLSASLALLLGVLWYIGILKIFTMNQMSIYISNLIAVYCIFYGTSLGLDPKKRGFSMGLIIFAFGIIVANIIAMRF